MYRGTVPILGLFFLFVHLFVDDRLLTILSQSPTSHLILLLLLLQTEALYLVQYSLEVYEVTILGLGTALLTLLLMFFLY